VRAGAILFVVCVPLAVCALSSHALANPPSEDISEYTFHEHQFGLSARIGDGFRALFTKADTTYCGQTGDNAAGNASACYGRTPLALDLEASYAVKRAIEVLVAVRLGLETDFASSPMSTTSGPHRLDLALGGRFFFSEAKHVKLFIQPMLVFDFTNYAQVPGGSFDFGGRVLQGVWIDVHKTYGFYFYLGETAELAKFFGGSRWLDAEFEGGFGFQGRYP
jgi:hypothetical protein